ncbi:hypothetical protein T06_14306 [Trichinella sp. T6]|nr:hypothetical protein T06_14306 [Trichinella sp. T6]
MTNEPTGERVSYRPNDVCQLNSCKDGQIVNPDKCDEKMQEIEMSSFHLVTAIFMKPSRKKTGSFSWQKIESVTCIYMAVKDQRAVSDETHENAQSSESSAKNPNKLEWNL